MALNINQSIEKNGLCKLAINEDLTIYNIDEVKKEINEKIEKVDTLEIDLENVEEIDSSGIQLLIALKNEFKKNNKKIIFSALSGPVNKIIDCYGINDSINLGSNV